MTYVTKDEVKTRVEFDGEDFYDINPGDKFDTLLDRLLKESKAIINGQIGGETLEEETGRVDVVNAPDKDGIELVYPINDVSKVEVYRRNSWRTLDSERYFKTEHNVKLSPIIRRDYGDYLRYRRVNPLRMNSNELTWSDLGQKVRITYDRGFSTIPEGVKETQIAIVNRQLTLLRQDQNLSAMQPDEAVNALNNREVLTDDIVERMAGKLSRPQNKYVVL